MSLVFIELFKQKTGFRTFLENLVSGFSKFKMKNTTGYSLNALVDFDDPIKIIEHLLIGSEGTLGFISNITYDTVPEPPHKASSLLIFNDIYDACSAVNILKEKKIDSKSDFANPPLY